MVNLNRSVHLNSNHGGSRKYEQALLIVTILLAHIAELTRIPIWGGARTIFAGLFVICLGLRSLRTIACLLVFVFMFFQGLVLPATFDGAPVVGFLLPFLGTAGLLLAFPQTRYNLGWIRKGEIDRTSWILIVLTSFLSSLALLAWAYWTNHLGIGEQFVKSFGPAPSILIYGVYVPLFALLNALAEEAVYRGLVQESLAQVFNSPVAVIFLQASAFAAVHYSGGFPNGILGYLMVLIYGCMLGYLRLRTKGIFAPYIAHVAADLTIAMVLIHLVR